MHILVINFTAETTPEQFDDLVKEDAPVFAAIEGLIHKNFIFNHEEKTYGGVYMFESKLGINREFSYFPTLLSLFFKVKMIVTALSQ